MGTEEERGGYCGWWGSEVEDEGRKERGIGEKRLLR